MDAVASDINRVSIEKRERLLADERWEPWQTAPKTGEEILVFFYSTSAIRIVSWQKYRDASYPYVWANSCGDTVVRPWKRDEYFTHWMPLPKFPCSPPKDVYAYESFGEEE